MLINYFKKHFLNHTRSFSYAKQDFLVRPFESLLTVLVIAISIVLPLGLFVLVKNVEAIKINRGNDIEITVIFRNNTDVSRVTKIANGIKTDAIVRQHVLLTPDDAAKELSTVLGYNILQGLQDLSNPLPYVLILNLDQDADVNAVLALQQRLLSDGAIDKVMVDFAWIKRMQAIIKFCKTIIILIAGIFSVAVTLSIGNTIKLVIENNKDLIKVAKLIGAPRAFTQRSFLYLGLFYGVSGGIFAILLINIIMLVLNPIVVKLAACYNSSFMLQGLSAIDSLFCLFLSATLGFIGALISVNRQIDTIDV